MIDSTTTNNMDTSTIPWCVKFGHSWRPISMTGRQECRTCGITGYCPQCGTLDTPLGAEKMKCGVHREEAQRNAE